MADFVKAVDVDEIPEGGAAVVEVDGREVAIVHTGGRFFALQNDCTHAGHPIGEGDVISEGVIECPGHGANFNVETGEVISGPADEPLETYDVQVVDGAVQVALE
jgi:3-phenylpropionate/trans-cinnamate dioxygenase ferredoxin subunit